MLAALDTGKWWIAALVVLSSLLAVVYVWRVVEKAYFESPPTGHDKIEEAPLGLLVPTWVLVVANVYFGIDAELTVGVANRAAAILFGGAT